MLSIIENMVPPENIPDEPPITRAGASPARTLYVWKAEKGVNCLTPP